MPRDRVILNCAIYTRKSSEEGLDQAFNSLHAQREACEAYIQSQQHEGWKAVRAHYDDGGLSGGTMDRPALQALLREIEAGRVQVVVVYKVDRLTRSLVDFAKIIETFDAHGVSFVSVTQQFNTTTSMGRLTLNVLLSFAQFEREVTGERIRDKIAASKKKGMWMGGYPPLGYDVKDKKLIVNMKEAETVRHIFRRYADLKSVRVLKDDLDAAGIVSKVRVFEDGRRVGGKMLTRGALYHLLQNRIYLKEIVHKGETYAGEHDAIIDRGLWDQVQEILVANRAERRSGANAGEPSLLGGLLFDGEGHRLTPSHATKGGKRYRYYVSEKLDQGGADRLEGAIRIPAREVETAVRLGLAEFLETPARLIESLTTADDGISCHRKLSANAAAAAQRLRAGEPTFLKTAVSKIVERVELGRDALTITCTREALRQWLVDPETGTQPISDHKPTHVVILKVPFTLKRRGVEAKLILGNEDRSQSPNPDPVLIKAVARAYVWNQKLISGDAQSIRALAREIGVTKRYVCKLLPLAMLAPDIVELILDGRQPRHLTLEAIVKAHIPLNWGEQRRQLGFKAD